MDPIWLVFIRSRNLDVDTHRECCVNIEPGREASSQPGTVVHTCNPSYLGGGDKEDHFLWTA
jgi:hypothetical protein